MDTGTGPSDFFTMQVGSAGKVPDVNGVERI